MSCHGYTVIAKIIEHVRFRPILSWVVQHSSLWKIETSEEYARQSLAQVLPSQAHTGSGISPRQSGIGMQVPSPSFNSRLRLTCEQPQGNRI